MITRFIGFAYASSPVAVDHGHAKTGCWYLEIQDSIYGMVYSDILCAYEDKAQVLKFAEHHSALPWDRYSMHEGY